MPFQPDGPPAHMGEAVFLAVFDNVMEDAIQGSCPTGVCACGWERMTTTHHATFSSHNANTQCVPLMCVEVKKVDVCGGLDRTCDVFLFRYSRKNMVVIPCFHHIIIPHFVLKTKYSELMKCVLNIAIQCLTHQFFRAYPIGNGPR